MNIKEYIESGVIESYVLGSATVAEEIELLRLKDEHPQIHVAVKELEAEVENLANQMAIVPPIETWQKIESGMNEIIKSKAHDSTSNLKYNSQHTIGTESKGKDQQFIEVEAESNYIRVHKIWRWILFGIFILGKIFLGFAIYFYLENRQLNKELNYLKPTETLRHRLIPVE